MVVTVKIILITYLKIRSPLTLLKNMKTVYELVIYLITKIKQSEVERAKHGSLRTSEDIKKSGEHVANLPENRVKGDGEWMFGNYNNVRVGVIKNDGQIGTITPDNSRQP
ncbi:hypothetical protein SAMN05428987_4103 [Paenibacillus sp. CF095]|uniref:hypothetical protein n=1 Tax=Paenibacillus sp. CF095 TaxID=1881033 RepID=UPI000892533D|nr:hypothetical protein SAMN05428987_4103 [Paenibacillus sp. CF095]